MRRVLKVPINRFFIFPSSVVPFLFVPSSTVQSETLVKFFGEACSHTIPRAHAHHSKRMAIILCSQFVLRLCENVIFDGTYYTHTHISAHSVA